MPPIGSTNSQPRKQVLLLKSLWEWHIRMQLVANYCYDLLSNLNSYTKRLRYACGITCYPLHFGNSAFTTHDKYSSIDTLYTSTP